MQWLLSACKWCVVAPKNPHTRCKWQTQQAWWQRVFVNSNRRVTLLRVSASTAVSRQLMWLNYFVNRPYNTLSDYVTLFLCCIFEYQVDTTLKRDIKRFWWNLERFQTQWCLLGAMLFSVVCFNLNETWKFQNMKVLQVLFFTVEWMKFYLRPAKYTVRLNLAMTQSLFRGLSQITFIRSIVFMTEVIWVCFCFSIRYHACWHVL